MFCFWNEIGQRPGSNDYTIESLMSFEQKSKRVIFWQAFANALMAPNSAEAVAGRLWAAVELSRCESKQNKLKPFASKW